MSETATPFPPPARGRACPRAPTRGSNPRSESGGGPATNTDFAGPHPAPSAAPSPFQGEEIGATSLVLLSDTRRTKHDQGFDGSALFAEVAVNLEIDVQRMGLDLRKSGFYAANRTRVSRLELQCCVLVTHVLSLPAGCFGAGCKRAKRSTRTLHENPGLLAPAPVRMLGTEAVQGC
jgi:hypothetical protein